MTQKLTLDLNNFQIIQSITDDVLLIENKETKTKYIATIDKTQSDETSVKDTKKDELKSYFEMNYPTILKFYGYSNADFNSNPHTTYITEYASNGSLQDMLDKIKLSQAPCGFSNTQKYIITLGMALGINFLHSKNIFLSNFQPFNILLDDKFYPLLFPFNFIKDKSDKSYYRAPETFSEQSQYTSKSDIFSFASIVFDMIDLSKINEDNKIFFNNCMSENPEERPTLPEVIEHITEKSFIDLYNNVNIEEIFTYLKKFIDLNDSVALFIIARVLSLDESRKEEVLNYYRQSADAGNSYSMHCYGRMLYNGDGTEVNFSEALRYFKMSADKGNHHGINAYGIMLLNGQGCAVDVDDAIRNFKLAIEKGNILAMYNYAMLNFDGKVVPKNMNEAARYFKMAADRGHVSSMINFAALAFKGEGIPISGAVALRYFKKAADFGSDDAMFRYASMLEKGLHVPVIMHEAFRCYKILAEKGDPKGLYKYGQCLINGNGTTVNVQEGVNYIKMAIDKGNALAMHYYALMLFNGDQIPKNIQESIKYYQMAADNGSEQAMLSLGLFNQHGEGGVKINKVAAIHYYKMAIQKGNDMAMLKLGEMLWNGDGVQVNKAAAIHYINMAMERGNQEAKRVLNSMEYTYTNCTIC